MIVIDADFSKEFRFEVENYLNQKGPILTIKILIDLRLDNSFARAIVKNILKKRKSLAEKRKEID